jgi:hypothetical protein
MICKNRNQLVGFTNGRKKGYLIILLGENKVGLIPKESFNQKRWFGGQFILGKPETCFSNFIKFKVTKKLKINYSFQVNKFILSFSQEIAKIPRKFFQMLVIFFQFEEFSKNIAKFFEFKILIATNGLIVFPGIGKIVLTDVIKKLMLKTISSL